MRRLQSDDWITRDTSLADLGISEPVVLSNSDAHQDFYLPVPRGVPIADATLNFDARYTKDEPGRTNLVLWADGVPLAAQNIADGNGPVLRNLPLEQRLRSTGFLRLGVDWQSEIALRRCESNRATANALTISPQTRLSYRYDASAIGNLDDAWSTLPGKPVLLVSDTKLDQQVYDSAWRMGVAMQRAGKRVDVKAFPAVGDEIDTRALQIPAGLAQAPVFAAVAGKERHKLASAAEIGALLVLGAPAVTGDVVIASPALRAKLNAALDALQTELASDPDAADAFKSWRQARAPLAGADMAAKEVRLAPMGRLSVIAVAPDAGAQAAGVFNAAWRRILVSRQVQVQTATPPQSFQGDGVRLSALGGAPDSFDVVSRGDWNVNFPLASVSSDGRMPDELIIDLAAAPGARPPAGGLGILERDIAGRQAARRRRPSGTPDGARARLRAGRKQRRARQRAAPARLGGLQRNPAGLSRQRAADQPCQAGPAPARRHVHRPAAPAGGQSAGPGSRQLPGQCTHQPQATDRHRDSQWRVRHARRTRRVAGRPGRQARAHLPGAGSALDGAKPKVQVSDQKQLLVAGRSTTWLDISGLSGLSTAEVVSTGGQDGVLWHALGPQSGKLDTPFVLNRGDIAVIAANGPVAWIDSTNPDASKPPGAGKAPSSNGAAISRGACRR